MDEAEAAQRTGRASRARGATTFERSCKVLGPSPFLAGGGHVHRGQGTVAPALLVAHAPDDTGKRVVDMSSEGIASTHSTGPLLQCRRDTNRSSARNIGTGAQSGRRTRTRVVRVRDQAAGPVL